MNMSAPPCPCSAFRFLLLLVTRDLLTCKSLAKCTCGKTQHLEHEQSRPETRDQTTKTRDQRPETRERPGLERLENWGRDLRICICLFRLPSPPVSSQYKNALALAQAALAPWRDTRGEGSRNKQIRINGPSFHNFM